MVYIATKNSDARLMKLRAQRSRLLAATDWALMPDAPLTEEERQAVLQYRTALRDFTDVPTGVIAELPAPDGLPAKVRAGLN